MQSLALCFFGILDSFVGRIHLMRRRKLFVRQCIPIAGFEGRNSGQSGS